MAQPQKALGHGGPMRGVRQINVDADGSVKEGDWVKFVPGGGQIQFVAAAGLPTGVTAVFTPALFGTATSGTQPISPNNAQNPPLSPNGGSTNQVASYMILGAGTSQGPYCVIVGGATMPVQVDAVGDLTPSQIRIPNSGLLAFNAAAAIVFNVTWTGGGDGPFGSPTLSLNAGLNIVHADAEDCTVQLSVGARANPPGTIKIGSGGSSPLPGDK
jgi:hypothetical protein